MNEVRNVSYTAAVLAYDSEENALDLGGCGNGECRAINSEVLDTAIRGESSGAVSAADVDYRVRNRYPCCASIRGILDCQGCSGRIRGRWTIQNEVCCGRVNPVFYKPVLA